jgi:hypothetical protein
VSKFTASDERTSAAKRLIPGGAYAYAKGDDQYPAGMAPVTDSEAGCRVWGIDGNEFVEFGNGLRSTTLGLRLGVLAPGFVLEVLAACGFSGGSAHQGRPCGSAVFVRMPLPRGQRRASKRNPKGLRT